MDKKLVSLTLCTGCVLFSMQGLAQDTAMQRSTLAPNAISVGANVGVADVEDISDNVFSFGAFADYALAPTFSVGATVDYWNDSFDTTGTRRVEIGDTVFGVNGKFKFPDVTTGLKPYALAGLAVHRFSVDVGDRDPNATSIEDKFTEFDRKNKDVNGEFGVDFAGGLQYAVQPDIDVTGEVRYRRVIDRTVALDQLNVSAALSYSM